jgi:hypothetical protein
LLQEPAQPVITDGVVSGYQLSGGQACFLAGVAPFCVSNSLRVRDGQRVRILHEGETLLRVEAESESAMSPAVVAARE